MGTTLQWGSRYLMVEPEHFRVDYAINPFMRLDDQPDPVRTREQWQAIVTAIEAAGGSVESLVKWVKGNFLAGRVFADDADLAAQCAAWLTYANTRPSQATDEAPVARLATP